MQSALSVDTEELREAGQIVVEREMHVQLGISVVLRETAHTNGVDLVGHDPIQWTVSLS